MSSVAAAPDGHVITASWDNTVKVWALTGPASAECVATLEGHSEVVKGVVAGAGWVASQSGYRGAGELIVWRPRRGDANGEE